MMYSCWCQKWKR